MSDLPPAIAASPVPETDRVVTLDVIRGVAVLGILVMNVIEFGMPMRGYDNPAYAGGSEGADLWTYYVQAALFDGRMRALFSMLFGAGIVLFGERVARREGSAADLLLRRCLWLIPFGIVHRFALQWTGDILYIYAVICVLAVAFRVLKPRLLIVLGILVLACFVPIALVQHQAQAELRDRAAQAVAIEARGESVPADLAEARKRWERRASLVPPKPDEVKVEIDAVRGSWLDIARFRWEHNHQFQSDFLYRYFVFDVLGMVLLGMGLMKAGYFAGRCRRGVYLAMLAASVPAALLSFLLARAWHAEGFSYNALGVRLAHDLSYPFTRLIVGLGWAALVVLMLRGGVARPVLGAIGAVGRMAFSNYILQTLLCTTFFFGWGLGWYGTLSRVECMLVFAGASLVQIAFSLLWLRAYRFGPLEWCWRALTYWQRPPMRRT